MSSLCPCVSQTGHVRPHARPLGTPTHTPAVSFFQLFNLDSPPKLPLGWKRPVSRRKPPFASTCHGHARLSPRVPLDAGSSWASGTPTPRWETSWVRSSQAPTSPPPGGCPSSFLDSSSPPLGSSASSSWWKVRKSQISRELLDLIVQPTPANTSSRVHWFLGSWSRCNLSLWPRSLSRSEPEDVNCSPQHSVSAAAVPDPKRMCECRRRPEFTQVCFVEWSAAR